MRWRRGRDRGACPTCGAELGRGATWCGSCGAVVAATRDQVEAVPGGVPPGPPAPPEDVAAGRDAAPRTGRLVTVVAVVALVGLVVAVLRPEPAPVPLLGQVDAMAGLSATGPPPDGLRLAWQSAAPPGVVTADFRGRGVVAADGLVRVGEVVVDLASGRVTRRAAADPGAWRHRVEQAGEQLVVVDTLTGAVTARAAMATSSGAQLAARARSGEVTLLTGDERSLLVSDAGTVLAELDGTVALSDRAVDAPASFPLREGGNRVRLVAADTGEVVAELSAPPGDLLVVDVVGDLALVARTSRELPGPETGVPWQVDLLDARTGQRLRSLVTQSAEPPRLLGTLEDGTTVLSTRSGREVAVRGVFPDGRFDFIAQVTTGVPSVIDAVESDVSALLATVGVSGGVPVGLDARRGSLLGLGRGGNLLWQADAPDAEVLAVGDGLAAALPGPRGERVVVADATDGSIAVTISPDDADLRVVNQPLAVLDGHVGLGRAHTLRSQLGTITWLDLRTGVLTPMHELFAPHAPRAPRDPGGPEDPDSRDDEASDVSGGWTLHGVTDAGKPIITRRGSRSSLQVLEPGDRFVTFELPGQRDTDAVAGYVAEPVGASTTRLAVRTRDFEQPADVATHVLDRSSGTVATVPDVRGVALVDDLLLAFGLGDTGEVVALVGIDAADGEPLWSLDTTEAESLLELGLLRPGAPTRLDRDLLVVGAPLAIEALSLRDGTPLWTHTSDVELADGHLVLGPTHVVVAATGGEVVALDRTDGTVAWRTDLSVPVTAMTGAGDHVLVGTTDGLVVHLDGQGEEVQRLAVGTGPVLGLAAVGEAVVAVVDDVVVGLRPDGTGVPRQDEVPLP